MIRGGGGMRVCGTANKPILKHFDDTVSSLSQLVHISNNSKLSFELKKRQVIIKALMVRIAMVLIGGMRARG